MGSSATPKWPAVTAGGAGAISVTGLRTTALDTAEAHQPGRPAPRWTLATPNKSQRIGIFVLLLVIGTRDAVKFP